MDLPKFEDLFKQIKTNFWIAGIDFDYPKIYTRCYVFIIILFITAIQELIFIVSNTSRENFLQMTQLVPCYCTCTLTLSKIVTMVAKKHKICNLTNNLNKLYQVSIKDLDNNSDIRRDIIFTRTLVKYYFILNAFLINVYTLSSLFVMLYLYLKTKEVTFLLPVPVALPFATDTWLPWLAVYLETSWAGKIQLYQ